MTTPSTPTSTDPADLMREAQRLMNAYGIAFSRFSDTPRDGERLHIAVEQEQQLLAFIRSLVEAQPCAVAGEARSVVTQYDLTPQERDLLTAKGVSHIPGRGEGAAAPSVEPWNWKAIATHYEAALRHIAETAFASKDWQYARDALAAPAAAAPVETEQPTCRCEREGLEKFLCSAGCHLPHKDGILQTEPAARPLPGGVPTGLSDEQILGIKQTVAGAAFICQFTNTGQVVDATLAAIAALSAGAPSSLQGERK